MYRISTILRAMILIGIGYFIGVLFTYTPVDKSTGGDTRESPPYFMEPAIPDADILEMTKKKQQYDEAIVEMTKKKLVFEENLKKTLKAMEEAEKSEQRDFISHGSMNEIRQTLVKVKSVLAAAHRIANSGNARLKIRESYEIIHKMISRADPSLKASEPLQAKEATSFKNISVVCPEVYKSTTYGYPFFYKGFEMENCTNVKPFREVLTIALNFHEEDYSRPRKIRQILRNIQKYYKDIPVVMATNAKVKMRYTSNIKIVSFNQSEMAGAVWNRLIEQVKTEYVFIGRDLDYFDWNSGLERLVREISYLGVPLAGTSVRTENGHWRMGCQQFVYRNYTLTYREGYDISQHECVFCSYVRGPFAALKSTLLANQMQEDLSRHIVFEDFFMQLYQNQLLSIVCPDSMSYIRDNSNNQRERAAWIPFAKRHALNRISFSSGVSHTFSCDEMGYDNIAIKGVGLPPCSMQRLADAVKFIMKTCEEKHFMCELQEGTLLGAVKFNKILPWERDADITILSSNYSAFQNLTDTFLDNGYTLVDEGSHRCCVEGREAGGKFFVELLGWTIEVYGQHLMDTEKLANLSMPPTKIMFDGMWVNVPRNPALYARNRYGREVYRHAQHWLANQQPSGWEEYNTERFSPCPQPGAHSCLDQYFTDGNLQFELPTP